MKIKLSEFNPISFIKRKVSNTFINIKNIFIKPKNEPIVFDLDKDITNYAIALDNIVKPYILIENINTSVSNTLLNVTGCQISEQHKNNLLKTIESYRQELNNLPETNYKNFKDKYLETSTNIKKLEDFLSNANNVFIPATNIMNIIDNDDLDLKQKNQNLNNILQENLQLQKRLQDIVEQNTLLLSEKEQELLHEKQILQNLLQEAKNKLYNMEAKFHAVTNENDLLKNENQLLTASLKKVITETNNTKTEINELQTEKFNFQEMYNQVVKEHADTLAEKNIHLKENVRLSRQNTTLTENANNLTTDNNRLIQELEALQKQYFNQIKAREELVTSLEEQVRAQDLHIKQLNPHPLQAIVETKSVPIFADLLDFTDSLIRKINANSIEYTNKVNRRMIYLSNINDKQNSLINLMQDKHKCEENLRETACQKDLLSETASNNDQQIKLERSIYHFKEDLKLINDKIKAHHLYIKENLDNLNTIKDLDKHVTLQEEFLQMFYQKRAEKEQLYVSKLQQVEEEINANQEQQNFEHEEQEKFKAGFAKTLAQYDLNKKRQENALTYTPSFNNKLKYFPLIGSTGTGRPSLHKGWENNDSN